MPRARQVPGGVFGAIADIEDEHRALVHEAGGFEGPHLVAANREARKFGPEKHHPACHEKRDEREVVHDEFAHSACNPRGRPPCKNVILADRANAPWVALVSEAPIAAATASADRLRSPPWGGACAPPPQARGARPPSVDWKA